MATVKLNALGLKCPQPVLKIAAAFEDLKAGNILEVLAVVPPLKPMSTDGAKEARKTLLWIKDEGAGKKCFHIQFR